MKMLKTTVAICGAGPAGLTLAHLLGGEGIDVILLEKLAQTVTEPRAIAIDGESLRCALAEMRLMPAVRSDSD